jgi:hypothetical protein
MKEKQQKKRRKKTKKNGSTAIDRLEAPVVEVGEYPARSGNFLGSKGEQYV